MKLARFIQTNMERLLEDWEDAVLEIAPEFKGADDVALRDDARSMLEFIIQDLLSPQTSEDSSGKALAKGKKASGLDTGGQHGAHRQAQGLSMLQVAQELRALRARVTKAWSAERRGLTEDEMDEMVRFNEAIDQLIVSSINGFSALKDQVSRLVEAMLKASPDPAAIFEPDGKYMFLNRAMSDLVATTPQVAVGKTPVELGLDLGSGLLESVTKTANTGQVQHREYHHHSPSGFDLYLDCQLAPVYDDQNKVEAVVKTSRDITERKKRDYEVWRSANFDSLTGIGNRRLFIDLLEHTLAETRRNNSSFALLFIDLDHFKEANDQFGHEAGDRLLVQVAERMGSSVRATDALARLGGDEFTLILKHASRDGAKEAARALLTSLERPFEEDSHHVYISASIGLTFFPDDGTSVSKLMHNADQAMYMAKKHGGQQFKLYEPSMAETESNHMRLNRELDEALKEDQLEVYFQPIIDIRTGAISRAEALLRWNHPRKGLLGPDEFLSAIEHSGMTDKITAFVLEEAVACSLLWRDLHDQPFPININESPASFVTRSLVDKWRARLTELGLEHSHITMELTPDSLRNITASGFNPIRSLGLAGLRLHLASDNFGIEPFSMATLQEFRMESVKIDRNLIKDVGQGGDADELLAAIVAMTHAINVEVVGVGIEKVEQLKFLTRIGCDYAQGFLFSQPLNQEDFEALLTQDRQINSS